MITRGGVTSLPRLVTPDERHTDTHDTRSDQWALTISALTTDREVAHHRPVIMDTMYAVPLALKFVSCW